MLANSVLVFLVLVDAVQQAGSQVHTVGKGDKPPAPEKKISFFHHHGPRIPLSAGLGPRSASDAGGDGDAGGLELEPLPPRVQVEAPTQDEQWRPVNWGAPVAKMPEPHPGSSAWLSAASSGVWPPQAPITGQDWTPKKFGDTTLPPDFFFGVAIAPAQAEDQLEDGWVALARQGGESSLHGRPSERPIKAWAEAANPEARLNFWSDPDTEIDLAFQALGEGGVVRLGVDWGRLVPDGATFNHTAMDHYVDIVDRVRAKKLKTMMTLFHHSAPIWTDGNGGWASKTGEVVRQFLDFALAVAVALRGKIDYWTTFNEPHVYALAAYCAQLWPPGPKLNKKNTAAQLNCLTSSKGDYEVAMRTMTTAHNAFFSCAKKCSYTTAPPVPYVGKKDTTLDGKPWCTTPFLKSGQSFSEVCTPETPVVAPSELIGFAHNIGNTMPYNSVSSLASSVTVHRTLFLFVDYVQDHSDFIGLNYYGREWIKGSAVTVIPDWEYSDSGRAVDPYGLYKLLMMFHRRYKGRLPFIITENGVSDALDIIRPSYLLEHLLAIQSAINHGEVFSPSDTWGNELKLAGYQPLRVLGYVFWTTSDNWEWMDGYCPKFGLWSVDREDGLKRTPRPSLQLFQRVVQTRTVTRVDRDLAWAKLLEARRSGTKQMFCRDWDVGDGMGTVDDLDGKPRDLPQKLDWRFGFPKGKEGVFNRMMEGLGYRRKKSNNELAHLPVEANLVSTTQALSRPRKKDSKDTYTVNNNDIYNDVSQIAKEYEEEMDRTFKEYFFSEEDVYDEFFMPGHSLIEKGTRFHDDDAASDSTKDVPVEIEADGSLLGSRSWASALAW